MEPPRIDAMLPEMVLDAPLYIVRYFVLAPPAGPKVKRSWIWEMSMLLIDKSDNPLNLIAPSYLVLL